MNELTYTENIMMTHLINDLLDKDDYVSIIDDNKHIMKSGNFQMELILN